MGRNKTGKKVTFQKKPKKNFKPNKPKSIVAGPKKSIVAGPGKGNRTKRRRDPFSKQMQKEIKSAGLPTPNNLTDKQFAKLQKQWYALASKDFNDIEWVNHNTGTGHDSGYLKGSLNGGKPYHSGRALYFQLASNYLEHSRALRNNHYKHFIWELHSQGMTYDEIEAKVMTRFGQGPSKYTIYYDIKKIAKLCYRWNKKHPEGLLRKRAEDQAEIAKKGLEEFYAEEYNWIIDRQFARKAKNGK